MEALSTGESYFPSARQWHRIGVSKPPDPHELFVHLDARVTPVTTLQTFKNLQGVWVHRATESDLKLLATLVSLTCMVLMEPVVESLAPLQNLTGLLALNLEDPRTLHGLDRLARLRCLVLRHFRRVRS